MIALAILQVRPASGAPGDIFEMPAPGIGADPPKAKDVKDGDASVATQLGALNFSYPIQVPPGRGGMAPQVALSYSSHAPIYGGIATGWAINLPEILEDTSSGRLTTRHPGVEQQQGVAARVDDRFTSSMAGGRPLVAVTEPSGSGVYQMYRAANDGSFARYQRMDAGSSFRWRVLATDGSVYTFGESSRTAGCANIVDGNAPLTGTIDAFGNEVAYSYGPGVDGECRINSITYGQNAAASLPAFASVTFNWTAATVCAGLPVGAQTDYRSGFKRVTGGSKLVSISAKAFAPGTPANVEHERLVTLGYNTAVESCSAQHAPLRFLASIQESAWGTDAPQVDLPAVTFEYGNPKTVLVSLPNSNLLWPGEERPDNLGWGYRKHSPARWPSVEAMLVDLDGDGLLDRATNESSDSRCILRWRRNLGGGKVFGSVNEIELPRLKWAGGLSTANPTLGESCALNYQSTAYDNSAKNNNCPTQEDGDPGEFCAAGGYCDPGGAGTACPATTTPLTYLVYRWMDMDGDGLTDLVSAVHGASGKYDIVRGNLALSTVEPQTFGAFPPCPGVDRCKALGSNCMTTTSGSPGTRSCPLNMSCSVDWSSANACMASSSDFACDKVVTTNGNTVFVGPGGGGTTLPPQIVEPYVRCQGLYPWFIYKNKGKGVFDPLPVIKYQPLPLESDGGDSNLGGQGIVAQNQGVLDLDGDGLLDAIARGTDSDGNGLSWWWFVWLGDGTGGFRPQRYFFEGRMRGADPISGIGTVDGTFSRSSAGLQDLNGDGLADHWLANTGGSSANIAFHDGTRFRLIGTSDGPRGELDTVAGAKPGSDAAKVQQSPTNNLAWTYAINRPVDVDGDGRVDVVRASDETVSPQVHYNVGGNFISTAVAYVGSFSGENNPFGFRRKILSRDEGVNTLAKVSWEISADLVDLDGDGIAESVTTETGTTARAVRNTLTPPRLLTKINNSRGLATTVTYASMHEDGVVVQSPGDTWPDGRPKASPRTQWVVKSLKTVDTFSATESITSYRYSNPRYGADDEGRFAFRGFEEVRAIAQSGARTVEKFSFDPDWSGRLAETRVYPGAAEPLDPIHSVQRTTWQPRQLFGGKLTTYHTAQSDHYTCASSQTLAQCTATPTAAAGFTRTTNTLTALVSTTSPADPLLWQVTESLLQSGTSDADGDRKTASGFMLVSNAAATGGTPAYKLLATTVQRQHRSGGGWLTFGKSQQTWDASYRVPLTNEVWFDESDANRAISKTEYDMTTGNVTATWTPNNFAGTSKTTFDYDARKLFVALETNAHAHQLEYVHDYGTGSRLVTRGPNPAWCAQYTPSACPPGVQEKEEARVRLDGLGRVIERWQTIDAGLFTAAPYYEMRKVEIATYVDEIAGTQPTSMTQQTAIDETGGAIRYRQQRTELDGHGRPFRTIDDAHGAASADRISSFHYNHDGTLRTVSVPDPTTNDASTVSYSYTFDSLGRATSIRRPDAVSTIDQSGVDLAYDGLSQTTTERVGTAGGQVAVTKTTRDAFGRLSQVDEQRTSSPAAWATTLYSYDPGDRVKQIVDPENLTTTLAHDFAGRRTQITRGARTWLYGYDKNGNLTSETTPCSPQPECRASHITTTAYDDLDRPYSKLIAPRNLSPADRELFGSDREHFTWDYGSNARGRLFRSRMYGPSPTEAVERALNYNPQGQVLARSSNLNLAGYVGLSRSVRRTFMLSGEVDEVSYMEGTPEYTRSRVEYDGRGLASRIVISPDVQTSAQTIIDQTRNVAGLVTKRRSDRNSGAMSFIESNWSYDKLGRITQQAVQKGPAPAEVVRQDLEYFGNDDPKTLTHYLGTSSKQFQYSYDPRHQLIGVTTTSPGYFDATYSHGPAGRLTSAAEAQTIAPAPAGSEIRPRAVNYVYGGTDPEQVTALTTVGTGATYASYAYDDAGNQTLSCIGAIIQGVCSGDSLEYLYDGKDQLRRATKKTSGVVQGSEEYWYDDNGQRVAVVKRDSLGAKTELVWFVEEVEAHHDAVGAITKVYAHVTLGTPVARVTQFPSGPAAVEYQFHGLASSTLAAVATDGTINASFSYTPFGSVLETASSGVPPGPAAYTRRHNDKFVDAISDLTYYGVRYYDKSLLGWTQADPLYRFAPDAAWKDPRRALLYRFSGNNPLRYVDPDGRDMVGEIIHAVNLIVAPVRTAAPLGAPVVAATMAGSGTLLASSIVAPIAAGYILSELTGGPIDYVGMAQTVHASSTVAVVHNKPPDPNGPGTPAIPGTPYAPDQVKERQKKQRQDRDLNPDVQTPIPDQAAPGRPPKEHKPRHAPGERKQHQQPRPGKGRGNKKSVAPADGNGDGKVTDDEQSTWMKNVR